MGNIKFKSEKTSAITVTLPDSALNKINIVTKYLSTLLETEITKNAFAKELILDALSTSTIDIDGTTYDIDTLVLKATTDECLQNEELNNEAVDFSEYGR